MQIKPDTSIHEALAALALASELPIDPMSPEHPDGESGFDPRFLSYSACDDIRWVVQASDLEKMMAMDLGVLPVKCIAIPENSSLFQNHYQQLTASDDLSGKLTQYFPTSFVASLFEIQSLLQKAGVEGYVVGGIPRDLLLYQNKRFALQDVDITVEGDALALGEFLIKHSRNFTLLEEHPEFGTVKLDYKQSMTLDIASTRKEVYHYAGALPDVIQRGVPLAEDIIRRDFTVNALAFSINRLGQILDYTNGIEDIQRRCIRVLHPVSFYEDPSRMLRALKFAVRFNFQLAEETRYLLDNFLRYGALVYKGGGDRIKYELRSFLQARYQDVFCDEVEAPEDPEAIRLQWLEFFLTHHCMQLANMELIRKIPAAKVERILKVARKIPVVEETLRTFLGQQAQQKNLAFEIYLCFLLGDLDPDERENTFHRLGLTRARREIIETFSKICEQNRFEKLREFSSATEIYQMFYRLPLAAVAAAILAAYVEEGETRFRILLDAYKTFKRKWESITLELDGNDLMDLGIPEGKAVGETLKLLLNAKLSGRVSDRLSEIRFIQDLLSSQQPAETTSLRPE